MQSTRKNAVVSMKMVWRIGRALSLLVLFLLLGFALAACSPSETPEKRDSGKEKTVTKSVSPKLYDASRVNCSLLTYDDAAAILGVSAGEIQVESEELYAGNWQCGYKGGSLDKMVSLNISISESVKDAVNNMDQYRGHLQIAKGTEPFKDDLAKGAYSDISGLGDDALWTAANGTLTVRKGNVSLQVQLPKEREAQVKVAEKFLARLG